MCKVGAGQLSVSHTTVELGTLRLRAQSYDIKVKNLQQKPPPVYIVLFLSAAKSGGQWAEESARARVLLASEAQILPTW